LILCLKSFQQSKAHPDLLKAFKFARFKQSFSNGDRHPVHHHHHCDFSSRRMLGVLPGVLLYSL
jgi:hypothetical protein